MQVSSFLLHLKNTSGHILDFGRVVKAGNKKGHLQMEMVALSPYCEHALHAARV